jgi:hypothetical protein
MRIICNVSILLASKILNLAKLFAQAGSLCYKFESKLVRIEQPWEFNAFGVFPFEEVSFKESLIFHETLDVDND